MALELPRLETRRLILRLATLGDAPEIARYYRDNRLHLEPWLMRQSAETLTADYWRWRIEKNQEAFQREESVSLFLFLRERPERVIGNLNVFQIVRGAAHYATIGYSLAEEAQGQGCMTEALSAAIRYAFEQRNLHRLMANYIPHNQRSAALLKRLGFIVEGYARDYLYIDGRWQDHILTSLTNPNWQPTGEMER